MVREIIICEMKHKFYVYQNSNFVFIKKSIKSLWKIKFYLYKKSNDIFNKKNIKFHLYQN